MKKLAMPVHLDKTRQSPLKLTAVYRWITLCLLAGVGLVALIVADRTMRLEQQTQQKYRLERVSRQVQSRLNSEIQIPLNAVASMQAFMLAGRKLPNFQSFDRFAERMLRHTPTVHGFAFVDQQQVIRHFYPLAGNERAIGLDLKTRPTAPYVERAIHERIMTISPPTVTVQGLLAVIARTPLYRDDEMLGLVQAVIDIDKALQLMKVDMDSGVHIYLEQADGTHFWGPAVYPTDARNLQIKVGDTYWLARVWLDPADKNELGIVFPLIWLIGSGLLLSLLFIVNRTFTQSIRLTIAIQNTTGQLAASESRWRSLLEQVHLIGVGLDRDGHVTYVNPYFCEITGYKEDEVIGKEWFSNFLPKGMTSEVSSIYKQFQEGDVVDEYLSPILTKSGQERVISWFNARLLNDQGEFDGTLSVGEDITARREMEKRLDYLAYHDTLTGLPNRTLFNDRLHHAVIRTQRDNTLLALLIIDLDQFKNINDSLGHFAGDKLLQAAAQRFQNTLRSADTVARLGGDEFSILLENIKQLDAVEDVANKILKEFTEPFIIEKNKLYISASIGIVIYPFSDGKIDDLLRAADTAMYHAKSSGRNGYRFYEATMATLAHNQLSIANNLHDAEANNELSLVFQPIVDMFSEKTIGFEALLRWNNHEFGPIAPIDFIPVAESTSLIVSIGYWVLREACSAFNELKATYQDISLSVNVSGYQFQDKDFVTNLRTILVREGVLPRDLIVEITETQLMEETRTALRVLHALRAMGCRIAIDDFGTGYSSLSYLRIYPVDILKIDRSFIADLTTDNNSVALLKAISMIADSLDIEIIAEGVETAEQLSILKSLNLKLAQGYFLGRPAALVNIKIGARTHA